jgi:hypothetical protein
MNLVRTGTLAVTGTGAVTGYSIFCMTNFLRLYVTSYRIYCIYTMEKKMQRGSHHSPQTIQKLKSVWSSVRENAKNVEGEESSPITKDAVVAWLDGLDDKQYMDFLKTDVLPRFREIKK